MPRCDPQPVQPPRGHEAPAPGHDCIQFPESFLWGVATSAYQVEGSPLADGAGLSNWHIFSHSPGRTFAGETGDVACDHYRRWREDVRIMRELGLTAYRFSIAWSRVLPEGRGMVNQLGLDFYARLIDHLLESGIQPCVTLHHWDLPAALDDQGGWTNRDSAGWFADYAWVVFRCLADRVPLWTTINEPWVIMDAGYVHGVHAPGRRMFDVAPQVAHNLLRAHGAAVQAYRAEAHRQIGLVVNLEPKDPASDATADRDATERADAYMNRYFLDPLFGKGYPELLPEIFGAAWPRFPQEDFSLIAQPIDFLGINYYTRSVVRDDRLSPPLHASAVPQADSPTTETGWEVHPDSLRRALLWVRERYGEIPLYITENGAAFVDPPIAETGRIQDPLRVEYLRRHLLAAHQTLRAGVDLRGYFVWSLLDNYEWACGYTKRFGIVHVNHATQQRTLKSSAHFYREVIRCRGGS
jgi:beta-glucosidase